VTLFFLSEAGATGDSEEPLAAMGRMIGGFAHELNNPLIGILGLREMLHDADVPENMKNNWA